MRIKEIMSTECCHLPHDATIQDAAKKMKELDCGFIPVGKDEKLCGIVTDRDIAVRAVAQGLEPQTELSKIMTEKVYYCYADDTTQDVAANMGENRLRRLVVLDNRDSKKLCGIVSVCDIVTANETADTTAGTLIRGVSSGSKKSASSRAA